MRSNVSSVVLVSGKSSCSSNLLWALWHLGSAVPDLQLVSRASRLWLQFEAHVWVDTHTH